MHFSRRDLVKAGALMAAGSAIGPDLLGIAAEAQSVAPTTAEQWGLFEVSFPGPSSGNPFVDVEFGATFEQGGKKIPVSGFYDGAGVYRVRFMPDAPGVWTYRTTSNRAELDGKTGSFTVHAPLAGNHGPARVKDQYRFVYADGFAVSRAGYDLLCVDQSAGGAGRTDAEDAGKRALQQDADVRFSEVVQLQPRRAASVSV